MESVFGYEKIECQKKQTFINYILKGDTEWKICIATVKIPNTDAATTVVKAHFFPDRYRTNEYMVTNLKDTKGNKLNPELYQCRSFHIDGTYKHNTTYAGEDIHFYATEQDAVDRPFYDASFSRRS